MVIEDANLERWPETRHLYCQNNLLLVGISTVGVGLITGLIGFILGAIGVVLGIGIAFPIISLAGNSLPLIVVGVALGVLAGLRLFMAATVINSYTSTAYHTCLYLWARDVEKAQAGQQTSIPVQIAAPAPLAAVLGRCHKLCSQLHPTVSS